MGTAIRVDSQAERPRVRVAGTVQVIRHDRIGGMPALEAELQQGFGRADSGRVDLVWLGRASIPGIEPGTTVVAEGRLCVRRGRATMFNPRYELRLAGTDVSSAPMMPGVPTVPGVSREPQFRAAG